MHATDEKLDWRCYQGGEEEEIRGLKHGCVDESGRSTSPRDLIHLGVRLHEATVRPFARHTNGPPGEARLRS